MEFTLLLGRVYLARRLSPGNQSDVLRSRVHAPADNHRSRSADLVAIFVSQSSQNAKCVRNVKLFNSEAIVTIDALLNAVGANRKSLQGIETSF